MQAVNSTAARELVRRPPVERADAQLARDPLIAGVRAITAIYDQAARGR